MLSVTVFFFFNDTATTEIYTLSLHDALPIYGGRNVRVLGHGPAEARRQPPGQEDPRDVEQLLPVGAKVSALEGEERSEEPTSELQSRQYLVCRLLFETKNADRPHSRGTRTLV